MIGSLNPDWCYIILSLRSKTPLYIIVQVQDEFRLGNCDCKLNQKDRKIKFVSICSPVSRMLINLGFLWSLMWALLIPTTKVSGKRNFKMNLPDYKLKKLQGLITKVAIITRKQMRIQRRSRYKNSTRQTALTL